MTKVDAGTNGSGGQVLCRWRIGGIKVGVKVERGGEFALTFPDED